MAACDNSDDSECRVDHDSDACGLCGAVDCENSLSACVPRFRCERGARQVCDRCGRMGCPVLVRKQQLMITTDTTRTGKTTVRLRYVANGQLSHVDREAANHIRPMLERRGYDADDYDIAAAYGAWSEDVYSASWMPLDFFVERDVERLLAFLVPQIDTTQNLSGG